MFPVLIGTQWQKYVRVGSVFLMVYYVVKLFLFQMPINQGYDRVAEYIIDNPQGSSVFINSRHSGNLVFHMRKRSDDPILYILPSTKYLTYESSDEVVRSLYETSEDIISMWDSYGVKYILMESIEKNLQRQELNKKLREILSNEEKIELIERFPLINTSEGNSELLLYLMNGDGKIKREYFELKMGRLSEGDIRLPIRSSSTSDH